MSNGADLGGWMQVGSPDSVGSQGRDGPGSRGTETQQ